MPHLPPDSISSKDSRILLQIARNSIESWLFEKKKYKINEKEVPVRLLKEQASFVTLFNQKELRGCIGSLKANQPLYLDVIENAFHSAFDDYRFSSLTTQEIKSINIEISILGEPFEVFFSSEEDLIKKLKKEYGVILEFQGHRGTFLPSVWESLPDPSDFLMRLKIKAGLNESFFNKEMKVFFYPVIKIEESKP